MDDDQFRILLEYLDHSWSGYRKVRKGIRWELHHLATDPSEKNFNIICLRNNILTYYRQEARQKVLIDILDSLLPGGLFIIGCHEKLLFQPESLKPMSELSYVFRKC